MDVEILTLTPAHPLMGTVADYAESCSWGAGRNLTRKIRQRNFEATERVFLARVHGEIAGYCTFYLTDCLPDVPYSPYISMVFVEEPYRGHRISEKMLDCAADYAAGLGYKEVFIVSNNKGLYEKYGYLPIDSRPAPWNPEDIETIFRKAL